MQIMMLLMLSSSNNLLARLASAILLIPTDVIEQQMLPMMAPLPKSWSEYHHRHWVDACMEECWENANAGYEVQALDEWLVNGGNWDAMSSSDEKGNNEKSSPSSFRPSTYGEITAVGARQLFYHMELIATTSRRTRSTENNKKDPVVFMDWGSGTGKLVGQAFLDNFYLYDETKTMVLDRCVGIELSPSRHEAAVAAKSKLLELLVLLAADEPAAARMKVQRQLEFQQGDLFLEDTTDATHVYLSSLCFTPDMMQRLQDKLLADHDQLKWVASLRKFPSLAVTKVEYLEMSWSRPRGVAVYFYAF